MGRVKYQHYVPRFYLDSFQNVSGHVLCYDKELDRAYQQSPTHLGGETLFYDLPEAERKVGAGAAQFLEKWFNPLESAAAKTLRVWRERLHGAGEFSPTDDDREVIANFMAAQYLRTPRARQECAEISVLAAKMSFFNYLGEKAPELVKQSENPFDDIPLTLAENRRPYAHAQTLLDVRLIEELATILLNHIWLAIENKTRLTFYTSDHPVVKHPHARHPVRTMCGFGSFGIEVVYPLTPHYSLSLMERRYWSGCAGAHRKLLKGSLVDENVKFYNSIQVVQSARFVYAAENDFNLARDLCRENPELKDPDRFKIVTRRQSSIRSEPPK